MKRNHFFLLLALSLLCVSVACHRPNGQAGAAGADASADSMRLDSANYMVDDSLQADVKLHVEFLTGSSPLAESVRRYTAQRLEALLGDIAWDGNQQRTTGAKAPKETATADDMHRLVDFYGSELTRRLVSYTQELNANVGEEYALTMAVDHDFRRYCEADSFVTFIGTTYCYMGGAHGMTGVEMQTFVRSSGEPLTDIVDTLQIEDLQPLLLEGICFYFNRWNDGEGYGENDTISPATLHDYLLEDNLLPGGLIPLPATQPALTEEGVQFVYSQYEIAPYAAGNITFTVPYDKIKPFLTKKTLTLLP